MSLLNLEKLLLLLQDLKHSVRMNPNLHGVRMTANDVVKLCRRKFTYVSDREQYGVGNDWRSHADNVLAGKEWKDDCDGFACTASEILMRNGHAFEDIYLIRCRTEAGGMHLVCGVMEDGKMKILDNRQKWAYAHNRLDYTWINMMGGSEPGVWREVIIPN